MNNKKIKEIMKAQGYTIEMLSLISNIPVGTLSKIISGITANPGFETARLSEGIYQICH